MIVRERQNAYIMIEQDHHAHISAKMAAGLKDSFFSGKMFKPSVLYAIEKHDYAWKMIDKQPFWNDRKQEPYMFTDFPNPAKTVFYQHGVDEVEKYDPYAALLCSEHYTRFLQHDPEEESRLFVQRERKRQVRIMQLLDDYDDNIFDIHYGLLQFFDGLSLYICMNEPGVTTENEHPFFKDGIPVSPSLPFFHNSKMHVFWKDEQTVVMDEFPFNNPIDIIIQQKSVPKKAIAEKGVINSYLNAEVQQVYICLVGEA
ncbi:Protein of unknown function [Lentibacillus halodurans]|uniref:DUF3891 domain-containing protein n=1 Tax=Lentibacillus halodurans TaxID=237679 RepID=A0A1I0Y199_9BACI|nr:DUF3891 family protein [Lentibacillus halodurans]SFB07129.1 Protein of unknown function [Lentibacillus halodurans]